MGRPEKPLNYSGQHNLALLALASWLRERRQEAGLCYAELAARTQASEHPCSVSTLQRAASGNTIPRLPVVEAYARACGASVTAARTCWSEARSRARRGPAVVPRPRLINTSAELRLALQAAYARAGYMPLREMERRARHGRLPTTTVSRMLKGDTMLSHRQLQAFLEVCGVPGKEHGDWLDAWQRAWNAQFHDPTTRLAEVARPGHRVVEYDRHAYAYDHPGRLRRHYVHQGRFSRRRAWEEVTDDTRLRLTPSSAATTSG
ncbi:helix-turn-helix domain-containing protein [Streptomyces phaeochromogenes]|uniref:helix-turn-helix domain-containing protein n=1 Tax=Streptomyces phaeochromogenes TaxID=1923 RepID=UPI00099E1C3B|nr:helix-turn-helix transcriptional regulator [Streptomyces phaeochromogenes]